MHRPLLILLLLCVTAIAGDGRRATEWPQEQKWPIETVRGYIQSNSNIWQQWNNGEKQFDLVDCMVVAINRQRLAFPTKEVYHSLEINNGAYVELKVIRARRDELEWVVVLEVRLVE